MSASVKSKLMFRISDQVRLEPVHPFGIFEGEAADELVLGSEISVKRLSIHVDDNGHTYLALGD
ncbi:MAG: hypothetical protein HYX27_23105 [Acidobacteria bacterium]|nr:hypothetical protein [Acidobacteriota bacterium]